jgi:hypothetical protein
MIRLGARRPPVKPRTAEEEEAHAELVFSAFNPWSRGLLRWLWRRENDKLDRRKP